MVSKKYGFQMVFILNLSSYTDSDRVVVKDEFLMQPSLNYDTKHMLMPLWSISSNLRFFPIDVEIA